MGQTKDAIWGIYRTADDPTLKQRERLYSQPPKTPPRPSVDWTEIAERFRRNLTLVLADELCKRLGLPRLSLDALPMIGYDGEAWTFPERDGAGRIIGIVRRYRDGSKKAIPGSHRGLTIPANWYERDTPLFVVEGQSDILALSLCAASAIGRPSNTGGADMLAELLSGFPLARPIVVMGENDQKSDGLWPGKDGAIRVASALAERLSRPVQWALPPDGAKDIRAWILSQSPDPCILDDWHILGASLWEF